MVKTIKLASRLDSTAAVALAEQIKELRGNPVHVDAQEVGFAGALGLQVLVAAFREWQSDENEFSVGQLSEAMQQSFETLGIAPQDLGANQEMELQA